MEQSRPVPVAASRATWWRSPSLVPGGLVLLVAVLTGNVLARGPLLAVDRRVRSVVHAQATSAAWRWLGSGRFAPAQLVTDLGWAKIAVPVLAMSALMVAVRRRSLWPLLVAAAGGGLLAATVIPAKILIGRPGPGYARLAPGAWGDFPSGHASTAGVCYGLAVLLVTAGTQTRTVRRAAMAAVAVVCFLVGVALVWCDYHWLTDVVAGWALAAFIVWIVWRARRWWPGGWRLRGPETGQPDAVSGRTAQQRSTTDDRACA
jgi:undecaprenyl-diphosphatase